MKERVLAFLIIFGGLALASYAEPADLPPLPPSTEDAIMVGQQATFAFGFMTGQRKLGLSLLGIQVPECKDKMTLQELQACTKATNEKFEAMQAAVNAPKK